MKSLNRIKNAFKANLSVFSDYMCMDKNENCKNCRSVSSAFELENCILFLPFFLYSCSLCWFADNPTGYVCGRVNYIVSDCFEIHISNSNNTHNSILYHRITIASNKSFCSFLYRFLLFIHKLCFVQFCI